MAVRSLHIGILLFAAIVTHDAYMAVSGHDAAIAEPVSVCERSVAHSHHRHDHRDNLEAESSTTTPLELAEACSELRAAAPLNREMGPSLADAHIALISDSTDSMLFAATSRTIVASPPLHPPNQNRAFFQVYRI